MLILWRVQLYRGGGQVGYTLSFARTANSSQAVPPVIGGILDKYTLGTKEALSVTQQPTIGGRWSW